MRVVQVPFGYYPDPVGGTEVYVQALARCLAERGVESTIAAPGAGASAYLHAGLPVRRFPVAGGVGDLRELYGAGDAVAARAFGRLLDEERPRLVHLHALTRGVSVRLVAEARARRLPVVFTYHSPTVSCQRGTLLRWGRVVCDGALDRQRCTRCALHGLSGNRAASFLLGSLPPAAGRLVGALGLSGGAWTALRLSELVRRQHTSIRALFEQVDRIVALCEWAKALLLRNGAPRRKLALSRHGLVGPPGEAPRGPAVAATRRPLRVAFLGRLDPTKGPDLLLRALRSIPEVPIELHLFGIQQGGGGSAYARRLEALAVGDPRIAFFPPVPNERVVSLLRGYHVVAVPSQWLETGPLVVLEAFAAGAPVVGSELGGIAELVRHEVSGLLVEPGSAPAWGAALRRLADEPGLLERLRRAVPPPRRMGEVAEEMAAIYADLVRREAGGRPTALVEGIGAHP